MKSGNSEDGCIGYWAPGWERRQTRHPPRGHGQSQDAPLGPPPCPLCLSPAVQSCSVWEQRELRLNHGATLRVLVRALRAAKQTDSSRKPDALLNPWAESPGGRAPWRACGGLESGVGPVRCLSLIKRLLLPLPVGGLTLPPLAPASGRSWPAPQMPRPTRQPWTKCPYHGAAQGLARPASPDLVPGGQERDYDTLTEGQCPGLAQPAVARWAGSCSMCSLG